MNTRILSAIALVTVAFSTPVFAQDVDGSVSQKPVHALRHFRSTYNQVQGPGIIVPQAHDSWSEDRGFDRSRIGDHDADFNPSGS